MATAMEPGPDGAGVDEDLLDDLRPKSPYGEPLGKFHVTTEWPQPLPRSRHARRPRADPRYRTQPVTFDEIREVDEDSGPGRGSPKEAGDHPHHHHRHHPAHHQHQAVMRPRLSLQDREEEQHRRITELKCPVKLEALNAAIQKVMKRPPAGDVTEERDEGEPVSSAGAPGAAADAAAETV